MGRWFGADRKRFAASTEGSGADRDLADVLQFAEECVEAIVVAARTAADQIRVEVETRLPTPPDPNVINRERLVSELAKTLIERAEGLSGEAEELSRILGRAAKQFAPPGAPPPPQASRKPPPAAKPPGQGRFVGRVGQPDEPISARADEGSQGVRLLATGVRGAGSGAGSISDDILRPGLR